MGFWPSKTAKQPRQQSSHARCSFCTRPESVAGEMMKGLGDVCICADCIGILSTISYSKLCKSLFEDLDPVEWRPAHMTVLCRVRVRQLPDGKWEAAMRPGELEAEGATVREAVCRAQAKVLASAADALAEGKDVGKHFSNHLDPALRECQF